MIKIKYLIWRFNDWFRSCVNLSRIAVPKHIILSSSCRARSLTRCAWPIIYGIRYLSHHVIMVILNKLIIQTCSHQHIYICSFNPTMNFEEK